MIQCGSRSLAPTQQRYATIELECLAIVWAIQKFDYYLRGLPHFDIWIDHRPLVGIFDKALAALENARLMRMREKIPWVAGKTHFIADVLSRYPVFGPAEDNFNVDTAIKCLSFSESLKSKYTKQNAAYKSVMTELRNNADFFQLPNDHPARAYKNIQDRLSIDRDKQGNAQRQPENCRSQRRTGRNPKRAALRNYKDLHHSHTAILLAWHEKLN